MIEEDGPALCEAMRQDLHKSPLEGYLTELGLVKAEVETAIECLDEWMTPTKTSNSALNIPCWSTTQRDPLGVVMIMGAWNYPMQLTLAPLVGAIAGGNCIVVKPGSYAVAASRALALAIPKYFDRECIKVIEGNREITNALLKEPFETIFFTGSAFVGKMVAEAAARNLRPCVLELGGKSPTIIDRSAHLVHAVQRLVWGTFVNGGQTCVRPDFVMVHEDVADEFFKLCQKYVTQFYSASPQQTEWFGRCINDGAFKRLKGLLDQSRDKIVIGGQSDPSDKFISPTVLDFGNDIKAFGSSSIMQDEIFGPLLPCIRYRDIETVIQFIRNLNTGKPLALYCFSQDSSVIQQVKERTSSGGLVINDCLMHLANHELPFGGIGNSGMGSYHGVRSFNAFTHEKAVLEKSPRWDESILFKPLLAARFPPYTPFKASLVKIFSLHWVGKVVNYPIPLFRLGIKVLFGAFLFRALGFELHWGETELTRFIQSLLSGVRG
jgi:aldehyde dehydrogenase (NAD+)